MDFVSEIIANYSETEIKYLNDSIQNVSEKINFLKVDALERINEKYVKYVPIVLENEGLLQSAADLMEDVEQLKSRLETQTKRDVEELTEELKNLKESLIESSTTVDIVFKLAKVDEGLKAAEEQAKLKDHYPTAKHINKVSKYLNEECKDLDFLDIYQCMTQTVTYYKDEYCREAVGQWRKCIVWTRIEEDLENNRFQSILSISAGKNYLENLIKTLEMYDVSDRELASFSDNLMKKFLTPVLKMDTTVTVKKNDVSTDVLSILCSSDSTHPPYKKVLENLTIVFQFFDQVLGIQMHESSFVSNVGRYIANEFLTILNDECLTNAIPLKREQLKNYAPIIEPITDFQSLLISIGFIPESNKTLETYFGDVETLFLNKTIEKYYSSARSLMKKDLHELVEVGDLPSLPYTKCEEKDIKIKTEHKGANPQTLLMDIDKICPNLFKFPKCSVSKSVEDLINLVGEILNEGLESDAKVCLKLFHLARDIIGIYPEIVPMFHAKLIHDIPQYSALLYNNLMYLAHHVLIIDYDKKSQATSSNSSIPAISCFTDLIIPLRKEAVEVLSQQIDRQQKILLKLIKESGISALSEYEVLPESMEKSIKACLKQLTLLKAVWEKVLPANIFSQVIGGLCTAVIDEITSRIVATSDIRADIATSLVKVLSYIQTESPRLFADPNEVYLHITSWSKLKELILVLGASLAEVGERWAGGKGPLAVEFTAEQVRQMVKALFQVSDRRAAILSRIK